MISRMRKYIFLGLAAEKERFLERLQQAGVVHLIQSAEPLEPNELVKELGRVREARRSLARLAPPSAEAGEAADPAQLVKRREEINQRHADLLGELNLLLKEQEQMAAWGDFDPADVEKLRAGGLSVAFYRAPERVLETLPLEGALVVRGQERSGETPFVVLSRQPLALPLTSEKLPSLGLAELERRIAARREELAALHQEQERLAAQAAPLARLEAQLSDQAELKRAALNSGQEMEGRLFQVSCWAPLEEDELLRRIGPGFTLVHFAEEPSPEERVPVLMDNRPHCQPGEDLVKVYSNPNYSDFDPSGWVLYCFAVFFGMILGDAGYGACLLVLTLFLHRKLPKLGSLGLRMRRMMYLLSGSVIFFGVISASYFGMALNPHNPLTKLMLMDFGSKEGQNQIMLLSIIMGMVHISLSLAIKVKRQRDWPSLGWILVIWAGFFLVKARMGGAQEHPVVLWVLLAGLALVFLFTSNSRNPLMRILGGLNGVLGIVQVFSDVLSYLRLFALGIATVYMAQTFNMLAQDISRGVPWLGYILAGLVLLVGHFVNLGLGVMGGVIHGLRLNFLEWYRWSFEGDGILFKPFRLTDQQRNQ